MKYFNLHTHQVPDENDVTALVNRYPKDDAPEGFYSIGIHPWHILESKLDEELSVIRNSMSDKNCLAIGECGLDKRIERPLPVQEKVFRLQLEIAQEFQKPVILHCVAAYQEAIEIKKDMQISVPMIIHGFSKHRQVAKQLLDNGFHLSFGKYLLRNPELEDSFVSVPADRFFLETDTIEESIKDVYAMAAKYRNLKPDELQQTVNANVERIFKLNLNQL